MVAPVTAPVTPIIVQQPIPQQYMMQGAPIVANMMSQPVMMQGGAPQVIAGNTPHPMFMDGMQGGVHPEPAMGIGSTAGEIHAQHAHFAHENNMFEPQDFKPADDDPSRYYMVRELDGNWTQRNRFTIDNLGCRWYLTDEGYFYAVRLAD
jgi:hypothetical protein